MPEPCELRNASHLSHLRAVNTWRWCDRQQRRTRDHRDLEFESVSLSMTCYCKKATYSNDTWLTQVRACRLSALGAWWFVGRGCAVADATVSSCNPDKPTSFVANSWLNGSSADSEHRAATVVTGLGTVLEQNGPAAAKWGNDARSPSEGGRVSGFHPTGGRFHPTAVALSAA
jgi:hypothetical protein